MGTLYYFINKTAFFGIIRLNSDREYNIPFGLLLITGAFLDFNTEIKQDADLTKTFEEILEMLIEINYEEVAIILDEF